MKFKVFEKKSPTVTFSLVEEGDSIKLIAIREDVTSPPKTYSLLLLNPNSERLQLCGGVPRTLGLEVDAKGRLITSIRD